ncbi:peptide ABC transporter substrate-binding protein [Altererythrobacter sp. KTW20L]|uniref:peptide ABC transporter substrate-binding protein n=1 Tax=Altererythrobacter sp. KTW20L TaxID=2942210 RepID=UPI0020C02A9F|nr:peptide ABC transporter substrate-binding protein [Altererythrobacter sp. KTW20L]MCL6250275.1 peptide ABC transporter substrate-binding protein [Altererythrobacter sp. KTW20L]
MMISNATRIVRLALSTMFCSLLLACGGPTEADQAAQDGILLVGNGSEPKGLDPHLVTGVPESSLLRALMEGLVAPDADDDLAPAPGVAESWESNDDFTVWTFNLRDTQWTNGDPVLASDFVYSWQRILSPALGAEYAEMLYVIRNADDFHQGRTENFSQVGVRAIDDRTLEVTLEGPTPHFLGMLMHTSFLPVNPRAVEEHGGMTDRQSGWSTRENYVGNGPFQLKEWVTNQVIEVERNPAYWDAATVQLNGIRFYPIDNVGTEEAMFRDGRLHLTNTVSPDKIPSFQSEMPDRLRIEPYLGSYFYRINTTRPPFDDVRVRRALALAIDKQLLVDRVTQGGQTPATGFTPSGIDGYPASDAVQFDVAEAQRLLAEAGYPGGQGFPNAEILINTNEGHRKIAQALQAMWQSTLGINVGIYNQEWKVYLDSQSNLDYDISRAGWIGDYVHPTSFLDIFTSGNGNNDTGWANPQYDALIGRARVAQSEDERMDLLQQAEAILLEEMPIVPIYWYTRVYLKDPRVQGWEPKLLDNHPYKHVSLRVD